MMFTIGVFILLLSIIIDDLSTYLLMRQGFGILETNPLYQFLSYPIYMVSLIIFYTLIIISFKFLINKYDWFYSKRAIMYKLYDVFIFMACLIIVTISFGKISAGFNNISILGEYQSNTDQWDELLDEAHTLKEQNPQAYNEGMKQYYNQGVSEGISYLQMIFNCLCAYLLFRVGYRVSPWFTKQ